MSKTYSIDSANGQELCAGLPAHTARRTAQQLADERDEVVTLYSSPDDGEEIEPTEISIDLDGRPRVTYGAQGAERVDIEVPNGWAVDWSSAVDLSISGTHVVRHAAPLVRQQAPELTQEQISALPLDAEDDYAGYRVINAAPSIWAAERSETSDPFRR